MTQNEYYNIYAELMLKSEKAYRAGDKKLYERLIEESNEAFENYEYAAGLRTVEDE